MKFGNLFEFHKIPEWYTEYIRYNELKDRISTFKKLMKHEKTRKLKGYYMINKDGQFYCIDFIKQARKPKRGKKKGKLGRYKSTVLTEPNTELGSDDEDPLKKHSSQSIVPGAVKLSQVGFRESTLSSGPKSIASQSDGSEDDE
jgi:hypothetical protein